MLLGVVFHAVWFYTTFPSTAPVVDVRANVIADWIFVTSHTFRMQLFFLLAGFFAHLLLEQRGWRAFAKDRLGRIAVPLLLGWLTIVPAYELLYKWGARISGQHESPYSLADTLISSYATGQFLLPPSMGGSFGLAHLWFLYYLLLCYLAIGLGRWLGGNLGGSRGVIQSFADTCTHFVASSFWGPVALALVFTPLLGLMHGWMGVDAPGGFPIPPRKVLLLYGMFFFFGWLLHRLADRLPRYFAHWRWHLGIGLVASIGLCVAYRHLTLNHLRGLGYPALELHDVQDWNEFRSAIAFHMAKTPTDPVISQLWSRLSRTTRAHFTQTAELTSDQRRGIINSLNDVLAIPDAFTPDASSKAGSNLSSARGPLYSVMTSNRQLLQSKLSGVSPIVSSRASGYWPMKLAYSLGSSLVMCTLLFGCLGAFQAACSQFSPLWRYLADASYWIYLVHLPVLVALEIPLRGWDFTALVKIPLLLGMSVLLCAASYHYLVRSTFLGRLLNGRSYPFHLNPWKATQGQISRDVDAGIVRIPERLSTSAP